MNTQSELTTLRAQLTASEASRKELREALTPFVAGHFTYFSGKVIGHDMPIMKADVDRGRAALANDAEQKGGAISDADGWIEWHGGECPIPGVQAFQIRWSFWAEEHEGAGYLETRSCSLRDDYWSRKAPHPQRIVAYRLADQPKDVEARG